jgi:hypothetical protein
MQSLIRVGLTTVVVLAACTGATRTVPSTEPGSQPAGTPATSRGPSATIASASETPPSGDGPCDGQRTLPAGRRSITASQTETPFGVEITFTDGWKGCGLAFKELGEPGGLMMIGFWDVRMVYPDPCGWSNYVGSRDTAAGNDGLMTALMNQDLTIAGPIEEVSLDGYKGKYIRLRVPAEVDANRCDRDQIAEFRFWNGPGESVWWLAAADAPGLIGEVWAVDVQGFRFVVQAASFEEAGNARRDEIHEIVESIDIQL